MKCRVGHMTRISHARPAFTEDPLGLCSFHIWPKGLLKCAAVQNVQGCVKHAQTHNWEKSKSFWGKIREKRQWWGGSFWMWQGWLLRIWSGHPGHAHCTRVTLNSWHTWSTWRKLARLPWLQCDDVSSRQEVSPLHCILFISALTVHLAQCIYVVCVIFNQKACWSCSFCHAKSILKMYTSEMSRGVTRKNLHVMTNCHHAIHNVTNTSGWFVFIVNFAWTKKRKITPSGMQDHTLNLYFSFHVAWRIDSIILTCSY